MNTSIGRVRPKQERLKKCALKKNERRRTEREPQSVAEVRLGNRAVGIALVSENQKRHAPELLGAKEALHAPRCP